MSVTLYEGDNRASLRRLIDQGVRVHSVVCDPPYNLSSITKRFGKNGSAAARVEGNDGSFARLSGGFMGKKWDATGIERDPEFWKLIYEILLPGGYIFAFSGARTGHWQACAMEQAGFIMHPMHGWVYGNGWPKPTKVKGVPGFEGWGYGTQAQKPALEPIYLGQRPFSEKTGPANILKHGVGAVNLSESLVPATGSEQGRAAANLILDGSPEVISLFPDGKSGTPGVMRKGRNDSAAYGAGSTALGTPMTGFGDEGSNSRFFHQFPLTDEDYQWAIEAGLISEDQGAPIIYNKKAGKKDRAGSEHPTVKPISLLEYLIRHITPQGGVILDPFAGSGTTGEAARRLGYDCILMEAEEEYVNFIHTRFDQTNNRDAQEMEDIGIISLTASSKRVETRNLKRRIGTNNALDFCLSDILGSSPNESLSIRTTPKDVASVVSGNDLTDLLQ